MACSSQRRKTSASAGAGFKPTEFVVAEAECCLVLWLPGGLKVARGKTGGSFAGFCVAE